MSETEIVEVIIPRWLMDLRRKPQMREHDSTALEAFRNRLSVQQASTGSDQPPRAPGFDYVRWKQHGQHRMHHNPDEYVRMCQGLAPYVSTVASTAWEGMDERRWAGLTTVAPEIQGLMPKSGFGSRIGSRDELAPPK